MMGTVLEVKLDKNNLLVFRYLWFAKKPIPTRILAKRLRLNYRYGTITAATTHLKRNGLIEKTDKGWVVMQAVIGMSGQLVSVSGS